MKYPDGETLSYQYNPDGSLGAVTSDLGSVYMGNIQYDEAGRIRLMQYGAGVIEKTFAFYDWNIAVQGGLLKSAKAMRLSDSVALQDLSYDAYDENGNLETITDQLAGPQTQAFTYDELNRIRSAAAAGGTLGLYNESYEYDATSGNLSSKADVTYHYDDPLHAHAVSSLSNGNSYFYDANGNTLAPGAHLPRAQVPGSAGVTVRNAGGQAFDLAYDVENRMVSAALSGANPSPTPTEPPTLTLRQPARQSSRRLPPRPGRPHRPQRQLRLRQPPRLRRKPRPICRRPPKRRWRWQHLLRQRLRRRPRPIC